MVLSIIILLLVVAGLGYTYYTNSKEIKRLNEALLVEAKKTKVMTDDLRYFKNETSKLKGKLSKLTSVKVESETVLPPQKKTRKPRKSKNITPKPE